MIGIAQRNQRHRNIYNAMQIGDRVERRLTSKTSIFGTVVHKGKSFFPKEWVFTRIVKWDNGTREVQELRSGVWVHK